MTYAGHPLQALQTILCLGLLMLALPGVAAAQDTGGDDAMDFTESPPEEGDPAAEGDAMDFSMDEVEDALPSDGLTITGIVVRVDDTISLSVINPLETSLMGELDQLHGFQVRDNLELKDRFATMGQQGMLDCVFNPVCLGRVGTELG